MVFHLISFGVSSSSYFFFSFFRKTSQMINMTMRTPREMPTTAPATIPTSLTSVNGKKGSDEYLFFYRSQILIFHAHFLEVPQHGSGKIQFHTRVISAELLYVSFSPHTTLTVLGLSRKEGISQCDSETYMLGHWC